MQATRLQILLKPGNVKPCSSREVSTATEVDEALGGRRAGIWLGASEVFQFAVRPKELDAFLRMEPAAVLRHRFADVRFSQYLRHQLGTGVGAGEGFVSFDGPALMRLGGAPPHAQESEWLASHWLYFYRQVWSTQGNPGSGMVERRARTAWAVGRRTPATAHTRAAKRRRPVRRAACGRLVAGKQPSE